jgi:hypothetical protein
MQFQLHCPNCCHHFTFEPEAPPESISRVIQEGPWCALGDGETIEDMLFAAITDGGPIYCPACGKSVSVSEESVGRLALELLGNW